MAVGRGGPDEEARFSAFALDRAAALFRSALLLTGGDWHLAEDLVQETLGRMYQVWDERTEQPGPYAHRVLVRLFLSHRRRRSSGERPAQDLPATVAPGDDPALRVDLLRALGRLSPADRAVLVLRFYLDLAVEEVAVQLEQTPAAIRAQTHRALGRLRVLLDRQSADLRST